MRTEVLALLAPELLNDGVRDTFLHIRGVDVSRRLEARVDAENSLHIGVLPARAIGKDGEDFDGREVLVFAKRKFYGIEL